MEDFVMIPVSLFSLPDELFKLYSAIRSFDWQKEGQQRAGCTASVDRLAHLTGKTSRQTTTNLQRLEQMGAIQIVRAQGKQNRICCTPAGYEPLKPTSPLQSTSPTSPLKPTSGEGCNPLQGGMKPTSPPIITKQKHEVETGSRDVTREPAATLERGQQSLLDEEPKKPRRRISVARGAESISAATWAAYAVAYEQRYKVPPVRNATVNGQLVRFVGKLGAEEAPEVAAFYVGHNDAFYVKTGHSVSVLLKDAEKLRTEWATGRRINATVARRTEESEANPFYRISQELEEEADVIDAETE